MVVFFICLYPLLIKSPPYVTPFCELHPILLKSVVFFTIVGYIGVNVVYVKICADARTYLWVWVHMHESHLHEMIRGLDNVVSLKGYIYYIDLQVLFRCDRGLLESRISARATNNESRDEAVFADASSQLRPSEPSSLNI